jgi:phthalate 4,5-dioxygenase oxygenase subunit
MTNEENDLLTQVTGSAPMGRMFRQYWWIPATRSQALEPGGKPERVKLLGQDFVAFRAHDGRVGFFNEACPHRRASLALARNEDNALRCIYHGWKFRVDGVTIAAPTQPNNEAEFCKRVPLKHYPVREEGGIVWVWLGEGEAPPKFVDLPFTGLPAGHCVVHRQKLECNWLQLIETNLDSSHIGVLHQSWLQGQEIGNTLVDQAPSYHMARKDYGFRYAAVRSMPDGRAYVRTQSFVMPWYAVISPRRSDETTRAQLFFAVPIDDETTMYWHMNYIQDRDVPYEPYLFPSDRDDWPPVASRDPDVSWGQDREAMRNGHFSGFTQTLGTEDFAIALSQGKRSDRTREFLGAGDGPVLQIRRCLLAAIREFMVETTPASARHDEIDYRSIRPLLGFFPGDTNWRELL